MANLTSVVQQKFPSMRSDCFRRDRTQGIRCYRCMLHQEWCRAN